MDLPFGMEVDDAVVANEVVALVIGGGGEALQGGHG